MELHPTQLSFAIMNEMNKYVIPKFRIGDIVRLRDGDGRPHEIIKIDTELAFGKQYLRYHFKDGSVSYEEYNLQLINEKISPLLI